MAINFPASPSTDDTYTENYISWIFNGTSWNALDEPTTASDLGLGNVDNTSDASKPVSTAQAAADAVVLAAAIQRANHTGTQTLATISDAGTAAASATGDFTPIAHATDTANPHTVTATQVGLGSADNTSDASKPVSTAQASADAVVLAAAVQRANHTGTQTLATISDAGTAAASATGDFTPIAHATDTANPHTVTKAQVGLGSVDNTSDANAPVSTAQQAALDLKQDIAATYDPSTHALCLGYWRGSSFDADTGNLPPIVGTGTFLQATAGSRPALQADGGLRFDGTADFLEVAASELGIAPGASLTMIAAWKRADISGFDCMWGWGNSANNTDLVYGYQNAQTAYFNQNVATLSNGTILNLSTEGWAIGVGEIASQAITITNNGADYTLTTRMHGMEKSVTAAMATGQDRFRLGRSPRLNGTPYATGDFYEMGLFGGVLTSAEIDQISQAQEDLYNPASPTAIDLYIVAGQSNADGKGTELTLGDYTSQGTEGDNLMVHYVGVNSGKDQIFIPSTLDIQKKSGTDFNFGPEMRLSTRLNEKGKTVAIVKVGISSTFFGTSVGSDQGTWWPFEDADEGDDMKRLMRMAPAMFDAVKTLGYTPTWKGIVWVHGESDGNTTDRQDAYRANMIEFLRRIRGATSPTLQAHIWIPGGSPRTAGIVTAMTDVALSDAYSVVIDAQTESIDLAADGVHYDALGQQELGLISANLFEP